jgi:hypothetical protein
MKFKRTIGIVSDMHVGSRFSIFPKNFKTKEGNIIQINEGQRQILSHWEYFKKKCDEFDCDTVLLLGDLTEGKNEKQLGENTITTNINEQIQASLQLLKPICKNRKVHGIAGTRYHVSEIDTSTDGILISELDGKFYGKVMNLKLRGTSRTIHCIHGKGGGAMYKATKLNKKIIFSKFSEAMERTNKFDILISAHLHCFIHVHMPKVHAFINPCWKAYDPSEYTAEKYYEWQPDIGSCILRIDEQNRINIWHYLMKNNPKISDSLSNV